MTISTWLVITMSARPQQHIKKGGKGWGSLLSGAVAGIESRLDNILAEDNALAAQKAADGQPVRTNGTISTTAPTVPQTTSFSKSKTKIPSGRSQTPQPTVQKLAPPRPSTESAASDSAIVTVQSEHRTSEEQRTRASAEISEPFVSTTHLQAALEPVATESRSEPSLEPRTDVIEPNLPTLKSPEELQSELQQARADYENVEIRRQEEVHDYLERIDALQAKLQYLAQEASATAHKAVIDGGKDTQEQELAGKDERIALLLEEGSKLSKSEVAQLGTIRNLRAEKTEQTNSIADLRRKLAILETSSKERAHDISRLEVERREALTRASRISGLEREITSLKSSVLERDEVVLRLEEELKNANARADDDIKQRNAEALDVERATSSSLRDEVSKVKEDLVSLKDQTRAEVNRAKEQLRNTNERNQSAETALRNEISTLEGQLEIARSKTEETSATITSDSTAKLMRQVEVLQRQYSVASENWQGIEASLQSRITVLERERDESTKHENDARRKAREAGSSSRRLEDQLDDATQRIRLFEHEVTEHKANADSLQRRANEFEKSLQEAKEKFEREKQAWSSSMNAKLDEERSKWQNHMNSAEPSIFSGSPQASYPRRTSTLDLPGLPSRRQDRKSTPNLTLSNPYRDPHSRRSSAVPPSKAYENNVVSPSNDSGPSTPFFGNPSNAFPTPSIHTNDRELEDEFDDASSPRRTINDMVSASTAAAGPSVQLVERMSASVRRLETEKAANKDELARLTGQRDEARKEVVNLMQEVEEKRDVDKKVDQLEKDLTEMQGRYAASLEMLGEKEERVGELEADVADLKKIYRELVERTIK